MDFLVGLLKGEYNFIVPISFIILGAIVGIMIFVVRYSVYINRRKSFAKSDLIKLEEQIRVEAQVEKA